MFDELLRQQNRRFGKAARKKEGGGGRSAHSATPQAGHARAAPASLEDTARESSAHIASSYDPQHRLLLRSSFKKQLQRFDPSWVRSVRGQVEVGEDLYVMKVMLVECRILSGQSEHTRAVIEPAARHALVEPAAANGMVPKWAAALSLPRCALHAALSTLRSLSHCVLARLAAPAGSLLARARCYDC